MSKYTVGIIGEGRFGSLLYQVFSGYPDEFLTKIYSRRATIDNKKYFEIKEICKCDFIIPCVPISIFEEQIKKIAPFISTGSTVVDVCSVKIHPEKILLKYLNKDTDILLTHPMFGPDSTKNGASFNNLKFIYTLKRIKNSEKIKEFLRLWKYLGCELIQLSAEEHDKQAAYTHAFAFLIGKLGIELGVRRNYISTKGFEGILYNQEAVENDTSQLFNDMMTYNPYAPEMLANVKTALEKISKDLE